MAPVNHLLPRLGNLCSANPLSHFSKTRLLCLLICGIFSLSTVQAALLGWSNYPEPNTAVYDSRPGVVTSYRFSGRTIMNVASPINSGGLARVVFPAAVDLSGSLSGTFNGIPIGTVTVFPVQNMISFLVPGSASPLVGMGEDVEIIIDGIRNPLFPGYYSIDVGSFRVQNTSNSWDYNDQNSLGFYIGNFVPNSGFEFMSNGCPTAISNLSDAIAWDRPPGAINTPDYFNHCAPFFPGDCFFSVGVPNNFAGSGEPFHGNGYGGGVQFYLNGAGNHREYLQIRLSQRMAAGETYILSFRTMLSFNSMYGVDGIGMHVSINPLVQAGNVTFNMTPSLEHPSIIVDKLNWVLVSGTYTASGGEEWITIGGFKTDPATNRFNFGGGGYCSLTLDGGYYYYDDVSVVPVTALPADVLTFTGVPVEGDVQLDWTVGATEGFSHFEIERSRDGAFFDKIGTQEGQANVAHRSTQGFKFVDQTARTGKNYYRLRQIDSDGSYTYSQIVEVNIEPGGPLVSAYPNPAVSYLQVDWNGEALAGNDFEILLVDAMGRLAYQEQGKVTHDSFFSRQLAVGELNSGMYILKTRLGGEAAAQKVLIQ